MVSFLQTFDRFKFEFIQIWIQTSNGRISQTVTPIKLILFALCHRSQTLSPGPLSQYFSHTRICPLIFLLVCIVRTIVHITLWTIGLCCFASRIFFMLVKCDVCSFGFSETFALHVLLGSLECLFMFVYLLCDRLPGVRSRIFSVFRVQPAVPRQVASWSCFITYVFIMHLVLCGRTAW